MLATVVNIAVVAELYVKFEWEILSLSPSNNYWCITGGEWTLSQDTLLHLQHFKWPFCYIATLRQWMNVTYSLHSNTLYCLFEISQWGLQTTSQTKKFLRPISSQQCLKPVEPWNGQTIKADELQRRKSILRISLQNNRGAVADWACGQCVPGGLSSLDALGEPRRLKSYVKMWHVDIIKLW